MKEPALRFFDAHVRQRELDQELVCMRHASGKSEVRSKVSAFLQQDFYIF